MNGYSNSINLWMPLRNNNSVLLKLPSGEKS